HFHTPFELPIAINLPTLFICSFITYILLLGIKAAATTYLLIVIIKVGVVLFVIIAGAFYIDPSNWDPFIPARALNSQGIMAYGYAGIMAGAAYVFFAYIGFDGVRTPAGGAGNPREGVPVGMLRAVFVCTVL